MSLKRVSVIVQGRVQGVFFRAHTSDEAKRLGLNGWVRNLPDGSVDAEFQGDEQAVEKMLSWLHKGAPLSQVQSVTESVIELLGKENDFQIRY